MARALEESEQRNPRGTIMTATSNPQAAADQARKNYRDMTTPDTSVPEAVRAMAEKTVGSKDAFEASLVTFERSFDVAGQSAAAFNRKIIDIAQQNLNYLNSCFDLAKSLAGGENLSEKVELQAVYLQKQFSALTAQAEEVRALKAHVERSMDELRKVS
jgi:hypothetical protein